MKEKDQPWVTPKLIVLARSQAEECVLTHCKTVSTMSGPAATDHGCGSTAEKDCGACQARDSGFS
jgi:hypothetical protein